MSDLSEHCMLDSVVGCVQGVEVTSEHCMLGSVGSPLPGHV